MKKLCCVVVAVFVAIFVSLGFGSVAQAYPEVQISLSVDNKTVASSGSFTATATSNVDCSWNLAMNDKVRAGGGTRYVTTYTAPRVTEITEMPLTGRCTYTASEGAARAAGELSTWERTVMITVLPAASAAPAVAPPAQNGADLPNTGGPNWVVAAGGLTLLLAGATAVTVARRRAEAELPAWTA